MNCNDKHLISQFTESRLPLLLTLKTLEVLRRFCNARNYKPKKTNKFT